MVMDVCMQWSMRNFGSTRYRS